MSITVGKARDYASDRARLARHQPPHRRPAPPRRPPAPRQPKPAASASTRCQTSSSTPTSSAAYAPAARPAAPTASPTWSRALDLVQGPPVLPSAPPTAGAWLHDGDRLDHHLTCAIVDVATPRHHPRPAHRRHSHRPRPPREPHCGRPPTRRSPGSTSPPSHTPRDTGKRCTASCATTSSTAPTTTAHHPTSPHAPRTSPTNTAGARATRQSASSAHAMGPKESSINQAALEVIRRDDTGPRLQSSRWTPHKDATGRWQFRVIPRVQVQPPAPPCPRREASRYRGRRGRGPSEVVDIEGGGGRRRLAGLRPLTPRPPRAVRP